MLVPHTLYSLMQHIRHVVYTHSCAVHATISNTTFHLKENIKDPTETKYKNFAPDAISGCT